jgi:hypothetical protein
MFDIAFKADRKPDRRRQTSYEKRSIFDFPFNEPNLSKGNREARSKPY